MRQLFILVGTIICLLFLFAFPSFEPSNLISAFRATEQPAAIVRGTNGSALTVNISFGDKDAEQWIQELKTPYPLIMADISWAERFPQTVQLMHDKNIPVGLLGSKGEIYVEQPALLHDQLKQFEEIFDAKPLWFRTLDENFPDSLKKSLWEEEINALGSSVKWSGGKLAPVKDGDIVSASNHQEDRIDWKQLSKLLEEHTFIPIEDVLFNTQTKTKKIPE